MPGWPCWLLFSRQWLTPDACSCNQQPLTLTCTVQGTIEGRRDIAGGRLSSDRRAAGNANSGRAFTSLAYSADGSFLLAGGSSKFVCMYDTTERIMLRRFQVSYGAGALCRGQVMRDHSTLAVPDGSCDVGTAASFIAACAHWGGCTLVYGLPHQGFTTASLAVPLSGQLPLVCRSPTTSPWTACWTSSTPKT